MRDTYIVGVGQSKYGAFPDESYRSLLVTAFEEALGSAGGIEAADIDEAVVGSLGVGGRQLGLSGPAVTEHAGLYSVPYSRVENACAAGGYAVRQAVQAVKSGMADVTLAGGHEVMTGTSGDVAKYQFGVSDETEWERLTGTTFAGVYAQIASAYLGAYDASPDHFSKVAMKNHTNDTKNPEAHLGFGCSLDDVRSAPVMADPLNLYHCCPTSDGVAAVLVTSEDVANACDDAVRAAGIGAASRRVGLFQRDSYTAIESSERAATTTYEMTGLGPDDVDFAEIRDCFTIAELLTCEGLSFYEREHVPELVDSGATELGGDLPVNPSGGLKSKGHPIGAAGVGQVAGAFKQLTGQVGDRQVAGANVDLTHNVDGSGGAAVVRVLKGGAL